MNEVVINPTVPVIADDSARDLDLNQWRQIVDADKDAGSARTDAQLSQNEERAPCLGVAIVLLLLSVALIGFVIWVTR